MKLSLIVSLLLARFNMSDADAAAPVAQDPSVDADDQATITVPAAHVGLFERIVALLKKEEQWVADNVHAGVTALEGMLGSKEASAADEETK